MVGNILFDTLFYQEIPPKCKSNLRKISKDTSETSFRELVLVKCNSFH
jgi:hypothetical protein